MKLLIFDTIEVLAQQASQDFFDLIKDHRHPLIVPASGDSVRSFYRELSTRFRNSPEATRNFRFVSLDEWSGMNGSDAGSCRWHLDRDLFQPAVIHDEQIRFFDGRTTEPEAECTAVNQFVYDHSGIDICILGIGLNGHLGMNEPGSDPTLHAHLSRLDPQTAAVGQKYFAVPTQLETGLTLGLADIMASKHVFLFILGAHKAEVLKRLMEAKTFDALFPASVLLEHPSARIYADSEAASLYKTSHG